MFLPFGEWTPDQADLGSGGATVAKNVWPRTERSYGPINTFTSFTNALDARCQGFFAGRSKAGNVAVFAGNASKLYKLATATFSDVSIVGGYTTGSEESWRFIQDGERVIATNYADAIQTWTLDSSSAFANLAAAAPKARHIAQVGEFVMVGNTDDTTDGKVPNRVWWAAIGDPTNWPTPGTASAASVQSDYSDLSGGGWVQALIGAVGGAAGLAICDSAIYRIDYEGAPTVFRFTAIEKATGTPAPNSVVNVGPFAFYLGEPGGFYACDGSQSIPIGDGKVDKYFLSNIDQSLYYRVCSAVDPVNKLVFWAYPDGTHDTTNNPTQILCYNWTQRRWSIIEQQVQFIGRAISTGYTLEQLDSFGTMETLAYSLDSRLWTGGRIVLGAFGSDHKYGYFDGSTMAATMETGEFADDSGKRFFIQGVRPRVDGGTVTAAIGYRDSQSGSVTYGTATSAGADGVCPQRISTRYPRARVSIAAGGTWNHAQGIEPEFVFEGTR